MKIGLAVIFLICAWELGFSQSAYLEKNTSGFDAGATVAGESDNSYVGAAHVGYSLWGIFDAGLSLGPGKTMQSKVGVPSGQRYLAFSPALAVYPLKQDEHIPLSIALNASYESDSYFSDYLSQNNLGLEGNIYSLGATLYRKFGLSKKVGLLGNVGFRYNIERDELGDNDGLVGYSDYGFPAVSAGCDLLIKQFNNDIMGIGLGVGYDQNNNRNNVYVSAGVNVVIPWKGWMARRWYYPGRYIVVPVTREKAPGSEPVVVIVNVPDSKRGFIPVKLVKNGDGFVGPQGELYPSLPTPQQLRALYGD